MAQQLPLLATKSSSAALPSRPPKAPTSVLPAQRSQHRSCSSGLQQHLLCTSSTTTPYCNDRFCLCLRAYYHQWSKSAARVSDCDRGCRAIHGFPLACRRAHSRGKGTKVCDAGGVSLLGQLHPPIPGQLPSPLICLTLAFITPHCDGLPSSTIRQRGHRLCPVSL